MFIYVDNNGQSCALHVFRFMSRILLFTITVNICLYTTCQPFATFHRNFIIRLVLLRYSTPFTVNFQHKHQIVLIDIKTEEKEVKNEKKKFEWNTQRHLTHTMAFNVPLCRLLQWLDTVQPNKTNTNHIDYVMDRLEQSTEYRQLLFSFEKL